MDSHLPVFIALAAVLAAPGCKHSKEEMPARPVAAPATAPVASQPEAKPAAPQAQPVAADRLACRGEADRGPVNARRPRSPRHEILACPRRRALRFSPPRYCARPSSHVRSAL